MSAKERILSASLELFVKNGVHGTSTKMIIEKAQVSNGSLFHHFANKDEILVGAFKDAYDELNQCLYEATINKETFKGFVYAYYKAGVRWKIKNNVKKQFITMFYNHPSLYDREGYLDKTLVNYFQTMITTFIEDGDLLAVDYVAFLYNINSAVDGVVGYLTRRPDVDIAWYIDLTFKQYFRSIVNF